MTLLAATGVDLVGKNCVVVGASNIVGRPMAMELTLLNPFALNHLRNTNGCHHNISLFEFVGKLLSFA
jgi:methylenetetrahydrofolate dehydrogenase (NADP+)/methenyltetrahydrofolate cyclohydrolase